MSLIGSPHCAAMCGGFVCFYAGQPGDERRGLSHAAYNLGRLISYVTLGAIAGSLGAGLDRAGATVGLGRVAAVVAGAVMIVWAGVTLLRAAGARIGSAHAPGFARAGLAKALAAVHERPPAVRALVLGLVTTLLPCGFLYAYVAVAAGTGSIARGTLAMVAFWLGTLPVMATVGLLARSALGPLQRRLPALSAAALMVVGLLTITGKFHVHTHPMPMGGAAHAGHAGHPTAPAPDGSR
jgi:hypothetical protein